MKTVYAPPPGVPFAPVPAISRLRRRATAAAALLSRPVRAVLLVFFALCAVLAFAHANPRETVSADRLRIDLADHAIDSAELNSLKHKPSDGAWSRAKITWSTGPLRWWTYDGMIRNSVLLSLTPELSESDRWSVRPLGENLDDLRVFSGGHGEEAGVHFEIDTWLKHLPGDGWLPTLAVFAYLTVFLVMVFRGPGRHRHGSRWSWFWAFALLPPAIFLYLAQETRPIWRPSTEPFRRSSFHLTGLQAFMCSIAVAMLVELGLGFLSNWLF